MCDTGSSLVSRVSISDKYIYLGCNALSFERLRKFCTRKYISVRGVQKYICTY